MIARGKKKKRGGGEVKRKKKRKGNMENKLAIEKFVASRADDGREATVSRETGCDELFWWFGSNMPHTDIVEKCSFNF